MNKIFNNVLFEKRSYLVLFASMLYFFSIYAVVQGVFDSDKVEHTVEPQIVLYGELDADGVHRYHLYRGVGDLASSLSNTLDNKINIQGAIVRNLASFSDYFRSVEYRVWGLPYNLIEKFSRYLKEGRLPAKDAYEVVIGSYAARYFNLNIGDTISISLEEDAKDNATEYIVTGILSDNMGYYRGALIISKDYWANTKNAVSDNIVLISISNDREYIQVFDALSNNPLNFATYNIHVNYQQGMGLFGSLIWQYILIIGFNLLVVFILVSYSMKGSAKKIGLMKALGLSNKYILKSYFTGFIVIAVPMMLFSAVLGFGFALYLNGQASNFYGFPVTLYKFNLSTALSLIGLNAVTIMAILVIAMYYSKKISPRESMLKL